MSTHSVRGRMITARAAASSCLPSTRSYGSDFAGESGPAINTENARTGDAKDFPQITNLPVKYRRAQASLEKFVLCALIPSLCRAYDFLTLRTLAFRGNEAAWCVHKKSKFVPVTTRCLSFSSREKCARST